MTSSRSARGATHSAGSTGDTGIEFCNHPIRLRRRVATTHCQPVCLAWMAWCNCNPPSRVMLTGPGTVRWAARSEDGRRSLTWRIRGTTNKAGKDEVYTGTRQTMGDVKLSLHQADPANGFDNASILAFTKEFAEATNLPKRQMATTPRTI